MATAVREVVPTSGLTATVNPASAGGDKVPPDSIMRVVNDSAGSINVTLVTPQTVDGDLAVADRVVAVGATSHQYVRVPRLYRNPADGLVDVTWSATTSVTFEVVA